MRRPSKIQLWRESLQRPSAKTSLRTRAGDTGVRAEPSIASQFHAINILRLHGEAALRGKLEQVKAVEDLKSVARASGLVLSGSACKPRPSRAELILAIVEAAKHYDAQRSAATA